MICRVGVNDVSYQIVTHVDGVRTVCPYYRKWYDMLRRVYGGSKYYQDVVVCAEWLSLSNFKVWMEQQDWQGKVLDKDLKMPGSRMYSPETCLFVTEEVNQFARVIQPKGDLPPGVTFHKASGRYRADCCNKSLGLYATPELASEAYLVARRAQARHLAEKHGGEIADVLNERYKEN